jgi:hypothetical protein
VIHLHLTEDEAGLVSDGLGRVIAECEGNLSNPDITADGQQLLRAHVQRLRMIQLRLQRPPPDKSTVKPGPKPKQKRVRKAKDLGPIFDDLGKNDAEVDGGFVA